MFANLLLYDCQLGYSAHILLFGATKLPIFKMNLLRLSLKLFIIIYLIQVEPVTKARSQFYVLDVIYCCDKDCSQESGKQNLIGY